MSSAASSDVRTGLRPSTIDMHPRLIELSTTPSTVGEYCSSLLAHASPLLDSESNDLLCRVAQRLADQVYGPAAVDLDGALRRPETIVSFAEHHASFAHPLTLSAIATQSLYATLSGGSLVNFSCGTVPLDNDLFPRGAYVGGHKVSFLTNRHRRKSALTCPRIDHALFLHGLAKLRGTSSVESAALDTVAAWWSSIAHQLDRCEHYWQQICVLNHRSYERMFDLGLRAPIVLPLEVVARDLLISDLESGRMTWLERSLFDAAARTALFAGLDGTRCFWSTHMKRGTFLFWQVGEDDRLESLAPGSGGLTTRDGRVVCRFEPEELHAAMVDGRLVPAASYALLRLVFQCGLRNFGGSLQYDYLCDARQCLLSVMEPHCTAAELRCIEAAPPSCYVDFTAHVAFRGELARIANPISAADLARYGAERLDVLAGHALAWVDTVVSQY